MNRNTKGRFIIARKNKANGNKSTSFNVPKIISGIGERASWGNYGTRTFNFSNQTRLSRKPKVAGKSSKSFKQDNDVETVVFNKS